MGNFYYPAKNKYLDSSDIERLSTSEKLLIYEGALRLMSHSDTLNLSTLCRVAGSGRWYISGNTEKKWREKYNPSEEIELNYYKISDKYLSIAYYLAEKLLLIKDILTTSTEDVPEISENPDAEEETEEVSSSQTTLL